MKALHRKLTRDLRRMPGQVITIALVVALGMASYIASLSTFQSLSRSRDAYYASSRFADVFARVVAAPRSVVTRIEEIPGVTGVDGRVTSTLRVEVPGFDEPAHGVFTSVEPSGLNALFLKEGRALERDDEVIVGTQFARAHKLHPGHRIVAVINGRRVPLRVVGVAFSPEYVWVIAPGAFWADDLHSGVFFMRHRALASSLGYADAVNDVAVSLAPAAPRQDVIDSVDRVLAPYGSFGAFGRDKQASNRLVDSEIDQLEAMGVLLPAIFLSVAAFLVNLVLSRVVGNQREQIAALRALGYSSLEVGAHYASMALVILGVGSVLGAALGAWGGAAFVRLYTSYFEFPSLSYVLDPKLALTALAVSVIAGVLGALASVRRVIALAPAEAMRPEAPPSYRATLLDRAGFARLLPVSTRMVLRDLLRRPVRLGLSALGIAFATAILVAGNASFDAVAQLFDTQFDRAQREDLEVTFARPMPGRAARELGGIAGVRRVEVERLVPVRVRAAQRSRETILRGVADDSVLRQLLDRDGRVVTLAAGGVTLSAALGDMLGVAVGDRIEIEVLAGERTRRIVRVAGLIDDSLGLSVYLPTAELRRLLDERDVADGALLALDERALDATERTIGRLPEVTALSRPETARGFFQKQFTDVFVTYEIVLALCAAAIAVGVVYNNARIALAARSRDLATLRILGFRRAEVTTVLISEQAAQLLLGVPLGLLLGRELARALYAQMDPELYRIAVVVSAHTNALAASVVLGAGAASALLIRRNVKTLDLVAVLKAKD